MILKLFWLKVYAQIRNYCKVKEARIYWNLKHKKYPYVGMQRYLGSCKNIEEIYSYSISNNNK